MLQVLNISLRNLVRQKRRNILLGIAFIFGALILILVNSFSHGISIVLFEHIVRYTNGHVSVSYMRNGNMMNQIFHDADRVLDAIKREVPEAVRAEEAIGIFGRAIGNKVADNVIMVGVDISGQLSEKELREFESNFKMISGSFDALGDTAVGIPVVLAEQKARYLNVKMGDALRVRFTNVLNQAASAHLVVVGIFKPANIFMASPIFLNLRDIRGLAGYGPHDIPGIQISLHNPRRTAKQVADRLHAALQPGLAAADGWATVHKDTAAAILLGFRSDSASLIALRQHCRLLRGDSARCYSYEGVFIGSALARELSVGPGDTVRMGWPARYQQQSGDARFIVSGIIDSSVALPRSAILANERDFYKAYYRPLPAVISEETAALLPDSTTALHAVLAPEYMLMKRCATTQEVTNVMREMGRARYKGIMIQVQSMYETASAVLNVEMAINLITVIAGMILFFIIMIGVVNTLRMTIKERTREIGTIRAIGMQRRDVRTMFILETGMLALFSSTMGTALAFAVMAGLSRLTIDAGDNPMGMLLVDRHLFFAPTTGAVIIINAFIVLIAVVTAFFPARRAANMSASAALRHFE